jgi:hypothetical protein
MALKLGPPDGAAMSKEEPQGCPVTLAFAYTNVSATLLKDRRQSRFDRIRPDVARNQPMHPIHQVTAN